MRINEKTLLTFANSKPVDKEGYLMKRGEGSFLQSDEKEIELPFSISAHLLKWSLFFFSEQILSATVVRAERQLAFLLREERRWPTRNNHTRRMCHRTSGGWDGEVLLSHHLPRQSNICAERRRPGDTGVLDEGADVLGFRLYATDGGRVAKTIRRIGQIFTTFDLILNSCRRDSSRTA